MIKLLSVNIQGNVHYQYTIPFLEKEKDGFDVVCIQELFQEDIEKFENILRMKCFFKPMMYKDSFSSPGTDYKLFGVGIFTKYKANFHYKYVIGDDNDIPKLKKPTDNYKERNTGNIVLVWGDIEKEGQVYRIATTHFTWTPEGISTDYQKEDVKILLKILKENVKEFILVGDLNTPRGEESFSMIAEVYKDNIPLEYDSSIDPVLHRVKGLKRMVDGLFSTPEYIVSNVVLKGGISDHKAVLADIIKVNE